MAVATVETPQGLVSPEDFRAELTALVDSRHCTRHPLVEAWAAGKLSKPQMAAWVQEHYHFTRDLWSFFGAMFGNCPEPEGRATIMENLGEEEDPSDPHIEMLLSFAAACGVDPAQIKASRPLPTTWALKDWLTVISTRRTWLEAAAGVHIGMESQLPDIVVKILPALRDAHGFQEEDIRFFTLHYNADQEHGGRAYDLVTKYARTPELQAAVRQAVREGTQKRWLYYDGVYIKHVLGYPIDALMC